MLRKLATNKKNWNPRATERANKQAKCQLQKKKHVVSKQLASRLEI